MLESGIDLPSDIRGYIRLSDVIELLQPGKKTNDELSQLKKENEALNHTIKIVKNKIKQLRKKQNLRICIILLQSN